METQPILLNPTITPVQNQMRSRYEPNVSLEFSRRQYTVKTASSLNEFKQAYQLRFDVFYGEMQNINESQNGFDFDSYDQTADLLIIVDNSNESKVVGTYRIISSHFSDRFYSQSEFDLSLFLEQSDHLMEVSRACVHKDYRSGVTLSLLWQGLIEYAKKTNSQKLFGCSSIWTDKTSVIEKIKAHFSDEGKISREFNISPLAKYRKHESINGTYQEDIQQYMSPLLRTYLKAGAMLHGDPAYDSEFSCFDFFTVLSLGSLKEKYRKKYC